MYLCIYMYTCTHTIASTVWDKYGEIFHLPINCDSNSQPFFLTVARTTDYARPEKSYPELSDWNRSGNFHLFPWLSKYFCSTDSRLTGQSRINVTDHRAIQGSEVRGILSGAWRGSGEGEEGKTHWVEVGREARDFRNPWLWPMQAMNFPSRKYSLEAYCMLAPCLSSVSLTSKPRNPVPFPSSAFLEPQEMAGAQHCCPAMHITHPFPILAVLSSRPDKRHSRLPGKPSPSSKSLLSVHHAPGDTSGPRDSPKGEA